MVLSIEKITNMVKIIAATKKPINKYFAKLPTLATISSGYLYSDITPGKLASIALEIDRKLSLCTWLAFT